MRNDSVLLAGDLPAGAQKLLVFGYFGGRNFGDELMLLGLIQDAIKLNVQEISIISPDGGVPARLQPWVRRGYAKNLGGFLSGLRQADALVFCGGTILHDGYPDERHRRYRKNLAALAALCLIARLLQRRVLMVAVGLGPFRRPFTAICTRIALAASNIVIARDRASYAEGQRLGVDASRIRLSHDLAFSAQPLFPHARPSHPRDLTVSLVAAGLTASVEHDEVVAFHEILASTLADGLKDAPDATISLLVVGTGKEDNDTDVAVGFVRSLAAAGYKGHIRTVRFDGNPLTLMEHLARAHAVIATRYHIAVASEKIGLPTFWIAYHRKVSDAAAALDVGPDRVALPERAAAKQVADWAINRLAHSLERTTQ